MIFNVSSALLDALVLSVAQKSDTYGYKITQEIRSAIEMSESTLYPVLRRLLKSDALSSYDREYMGRNRRYYKITPYGSELLEKYRDEWENFKERIGDVLNESDGGENLEQTAVFG
ncbi:MAG: PadR family transcriptional regulator [Ruminococcus sp.]|jgi:PadR family transcriptional regulator PadR|nr:PadR family transcriptional regulator [Ruminococcus sp.]